jgi:hypothetical protein
MRPSMSTADEIAEIPIEKLRDAVNDVSIQLEELRERMAAVINELAEDIAEMAGRLENPQGADLADAVEALLDEAVLMPARPCSPSTTPWDARNQRGRRNEG